MSDPTEKSTDANAPANAPTNTPFDDEATIHSINEDDIIDESNMSADYNSESIETDTKYDDYVAENAALKDKILRMMAEMENLRRRTEKEIKDTAKYSVASFARDMLTVIDNLERALDTVPEEHRVNADETLKALLDGVDMTSRDMSNQLTKHGVEKIEPEGEKFNPNFHQAMFEIPDPSIANNTVVQVVQAGYMIADRVLRPAMVGVAKGGPKTSPQETHPGTNENNNESKHTIDKTV